jgi:hypothetical protein
MDEILTLEEMESRFPSEWLLIGDPQTDDQQRLVAGRVLFHSPDRDERDRKMLELRLPRFAVRYTGPFPEHMVMNL